MFIHKYTFFTLITSFQYTKSLYNSAWCNWFKQITFKIGVLKKRTQSDNFRDQNTISKGTYQGVVPLHKGPHQVGTHCQREHTCPPLIGILSECLVYCILPLPYRTCTHVPAIEAPNYFYLKKKKLKLLYFGCIKKPFYLLSYQSSIVGPMVGWCDSKPNKILAK